MLNNDELNEVLTQGGNVSIHYLAKFSGVAMADIYLCNNNEDINYLNQVFTACAFSFTPPKNDGSGAKLSLISLPNENENVYNELEKAQHNENVRLDIIQVVASRNKDTNALEFTPINYYYFKFGNMGYNYQGELEYTPIEDDRNSMTFPPYQFDSENNRGNA